MFSPNKSLCNHLFICLLLLAFNSHSTELSSEDSVNEQIEILQTDDTLTPKETIKRLDLLIAHSEKEQWFTAITHANTLKAELFSYLEEVNSAEQLANQFIPIAKTQEKPRIYLRLLLVKLNVLNSKGDSNEAEEIISTLLTASKDYPKQREAASIFMTVGQNRYVNEKFQLALELFQDAYQIYSDLDDTDNLSYALNSLANLYTELGDGETAIEYLKEAVEVQRELDAPMSVSIMLYNLGSAYIKIKAFEQAKKVIEESLLISIKLDDKIGVNWSKQAIAGIHLKQQNPKLALSYYLETAKIFESSGDTRMFFHALLGQFDCYYLLKDKESASKTLYKLELIVNKLNSTLYSSDYLKRSAQLAYLEADYKQAYEKHILFSEEMDDLHRKERSKDIQKQKVRFDSQITENKNKILQKENELKALRIERQEKENQFWLLLVIFSLFTIIVIALVLYRQTLNRNMFKNMALRDHLTNSPNRRCILNKAEKRFIQAKNNEFSLAIGIIDLDFFKKINDIYGHDAGDEVLKSFALSCKTSLRKEDSFGRYGGEEWLIVLTDIQMKDIETICQRLHTSLNEVDITGYPNYKAINFSMGVANYNAETTTSLQEMITHADNNLYKAKEAGRNCIAFDDKFYLFK